MGKTKKAMIEQEDDWIKQDIQPQEEQQEQEEEDVFLETLKSAARAQRERSKLVDAMYDIWVLASLNEKKHEMDGDDLRGILRTICAVCQVVTEDVLEESVEGIEGGESDED